MIRPNLQNECLIKKIMCREKKESESSVSLILQRFEALGRNIYV